VRREYVLSAGRVRLVSESACPATPPVYTPQAASATESATGTAPTTPPPPQSFFQRLKNRLKALTQ
jgi:hypothetical protein